MNSNLKIFEHPELGAVRALEIHNESWFVGKDVARALRCKNPQTALKTHVPCADKQLLLKSEYPDLAEQLPNRGLTIISLDGLYSLVYAIKHPLAKQFKSWIESGVLPELQKQKNALKNNVSSEKSLQNTSLTGDKSLIQAFESPEFGTVRTLEEGGKVLFCGKDIATALGYSDTVNALKQHCRGVVKRHLIDSLGRQQEAGFITEGDLYRLIAHSKLPSAVKFERWVFDDVLPTIRKHGLYAAEELLDNPDVMIKVLQELQKERAAKEALTEENEQLTRDKNLLEQKNATQVRRIALLQPKAKYYDTCLFCEDLFPISIISKDFGWSANQMNKFLSDLGVQYRQGEGWLLAQKYAERGYARSRTYLSVGKDGKPHASIRTCWTQKGRRFIVNLMKEHGHLPIAANDIA